MILPPIASRDDYVAVYTNDDVWLPAMQVICARHSLDPAGLKRLGLGTHIVFSSDSTVIKLFCPLWEGDYPAEEAALEVVRGLPTPELIATGVLEGWPYLLMTVMAGQPAEEVWDSLDGRGQAAIISQLGSLMAKLHRQPPIPRLAIDWNDFLARRLSQWPEHHKPAEPWRNWLAERLDNFIEPSFQPVLLHADITADNLLLSDSGGRWRITGLIDFGDAMMGHPNYEFIAPLTFYTLGRPHLSRLLLESYGLDVTPDRAQRITTYCFLHRFGRLSDYLAHYPIADGPSFQRALWGDNS